jgi:hypothetical protein
MTLKPCPYCGSEKLADCYTYIKCMECLMEGPKTNKGNNDSHADYLDHSNAVAMWNILSKNVSQGESK